MRKTLHVIAKILFNIAAVLLCIYLIVSTLVTDGQVENLLTDWVFKDKPADVIVNTGKEPVRYKSWYSSVEDNLNGNGEIAWAAQGEGTVLLQNDGSVLPLSENDKVSLFGVTAYDPMYSLDGAGNSKINDPQAYSGTKSEINRRQFFYDEFDKVGLDMNENLKNWYDAGDGLQYRRFDTIGFWGKDAGNGELPAVKEVPWSALTDSVRDYAGYGKNTTAIYITGRMTNEAIDLPSVNFQAKTVTEDNKTGIRGSGNEAVSNDYLALTANEQAVIAGLKEKYSKLIVLFNQANPPQSDLPEILKSTGDCNVAAMWIGFPGSDGIKAVADILVGKINPSGGLSAGWYTSQYNNPSMRNYSLSGNVTNIEGLYVGYRYAETRYEDMLEGVASYDYDKSVSYPFGYGLSYTTFTYGMPTVIADPDPAKNYYSGGLMAYNNGLFMQANGGSIEQGYTGNHGKKRPDGELRATGSDLGDNDDLIMKVPVTNSGSRAGKEIVQIYLQQPITDTDKAHKVQKPAVQLIGYGKTKLLKPGESETVEIKIDANKWFAAYDDEIDGGATYTGGGYVLSAGDYLLVAARNAHEAVNSIYKHKHGGATGTGFDNTYGIGDSANVFTVSVSEARSQSYKYWTNGAGYSYVEDGSLVNSTAVRNLFSDMDPNKDSDSSNDAVYFDRYDWATTAAQATVSTSFIGESGASSRNNSPTATFHSDDPITPAMIDAYESYYKIDFDDTAYTYGWSNTSLKLADMVGVEYNPANGASEEDVAKWAQIVGQLTFETGKDKQPHLFSTGRRQTVAISSIGKPATTDENASNGFEWLYGMSENGESNVGFYHKFDPTAKRAYPTGYPCEGIIAATFNNELARLVGQAIGEDALWSGASGIYGFGLGLQRNPYHGRTGEFYSDDPFLTGMIGGYETLGAQEKGLYVYNKHFVLNDQEMNRASYYAWLDEQTFRQVYLRPFEMAIEIGDAMNVMIAFNKNGNCWGGSNYNIMTRWLRGEAGMNGFAVTDWYPTGGENLGYGILAGCDLSDGPCGASFSPGSDARYDNCVVKSATRILYTVANSNAMNFIGEGTQIYTYDARWIYYRDVLIQRCGPAFIATFAVCYAFLVGTTIWTILGNRKSERSASDGDNEETEASDDMET